MRTSKEISTISYNSKDFLIDKLNHLIEKHTISDYMFIYHNAEADESKNHFHLWMRPNTLVDTMDIQNYLMEYDSMHPTKPLKCIDFRVSNYDDWILYGQHYVPYLAFKGEAREYHYSREDFIYYDEDTFENYYNHAFKGSDFAKRYQIIESLKEYSDNPTALIDNGTISLNMASQLNAYMYMKTNYDYLDRNGRSNHEYNQDIKKKSKEVNKNV